MMTTTITPSSHKTSLSLLGRASTGDQVAWQKIVQLYGPLVYAWARRTGLQPQDAADATQETFASIATRLHTFDPHRQDSTFRGWLWTITRNKAADLVRHRVNQGDARGGSSNLALLNSLSKPVQPTEFSDSTPDSATDQQEIVRRALAILRTNFEPNTWQAFWRTAVDGLPPDEVAAELSMTRWAVYKARSRVLHRLRTELDGLEEV